VSDKGFKYHLSDISLSPGYPESETKLSRFVDVARNLSLGH